MNLHFSVDGHDVTHLALFTTAIRKSSTERISTASIEFLSDFGSGSKYGTANYGEGTYAFTPLEGSEVILTDDSSVRQFGGYITSVERVLESGNLTRFRCTCSDYGILLNRVTVNGTYTSSSDKDIILNALASVTGITVSAANISLIIANLATFEAKDITGRELLDRICDLTNGEWRVDYSGNLFYYLSGSISAPYSLSDAFDGVTSFPCRMDRVTRDFSSGANRITVLGGFSTSGAEIISTAQDLESQSKYGILAATVVDRGIADQASADLRGQAEIAQRASPVVNGSLTTWKDGFDVGQTCYIRNGPYNISGNYILRSIGIRFITKGDAMDIDGMEGRAEYTIEFGQRLPDLIARLRRLELQSRQPTYVPVANPAPLSITTSNFAATIAPVFIVGAKPTVWTSYPADAVFILTTDRVLYRRNGDDWTRSIYAVDMVDQIQAGQIAADAVTAGTIAAGAIRAVDAVFQTGAIQSADIQSLSASKITAGTIDASVITVTNLNATNITAGSMNGVRLTDGTVSDSKIASLAVSKLTAGTATFSGTVTFQNSSGPSVRIDGTSVLVTIPGGTVNMHGSGFGGGILSVTGSGSASAELGTDIGGTGSLRVDGNIVVKSRYSSRPATTTEIINCLVYHGLCV